jgi:hypothetical protein
MNMKSFGILLIIVGAMVAAGSANDCDGACMEQANDIGTMLLVAAGGILTMLVGAALAYSPKNG